MNYVTVSRFVLIMGEASTQRFIYEALQNNQAPADVVTFVLTYRTNSGTVIFFAQISLAFTVP